MAERSHAVIIMALQAEGSNMLSSPPYSFASSLPSPPAPSLLPPVSLHPCSISPSLLSFSHPFSLLLSSPSCSILSFFPSSPPCFSISLPHCIFLTLTSLLLPPSSLPFLHLCNHLLSISPISVLPSLPSSPLLTTFPSSSFHPEKPWSVAQVQAFLGRTPLPLPS